MQNISSFLNNKKEIFYIIIIFLFSISINQYYGNLGVCPIDSFWFFNAGYDTLNGYYPFRDYWTISGPFITFTQAILFKILGISWFSYVLHASLFNFLISITTFYTLYKFKLRTEYCLLYSILIAILSYPSAGTPFVDHHASILSIISLLFFILAIKTKSKIYWFLLPIILVVSFLSKQTPTGNIFLLISILSIYYFILNFDIKKIFSGFLGSLTIIIFFFIILFFTKISFESFYEQYITFPLTIGKDRVEYFLLPFEFSRVFLKFKLIHIPLLVLIFVIIKKMKDDIKFIKNDDFIIIFSLLASSYVFIAHQLMTLNGLFIFFIIPIIIGFSHFYLLENYKNKNYLINSLVILSICSTLYYGYKYIHKRDFMDLRNANFNETVDAKIFDDKLKGLKWISCYHLENPEKELKNLLEAIDIIKNDQRKKSIITEYQFISVILSVNDHSPSQVWFMNHVANLDKNSRLFKSYKSLLINQIKNNQIKVAYLIKPFWDSDTVYENAIDNNCYVKTEITEIVTSYQFINCDELNQ